MVPNLDAGGTISIKEAQLLTNDFAKKFPSQIKALYISSANVQILLDQPGCAGIRIYNGYDNNQARINHFLVGVDSNGNDIAQIVMDRMIPCPPDCPPASPFI